MQDKDMVNDVLTQVKSSLTGYATVISESSNQQLRQTIQQIRDSCETFQYDLYKMAEQKGYYKAASQADQAEIVNVKMQLTSG